MIYTNVCHPNVYTHFFTVVDHGKIQIRFKLTFDENICSKTISNYQIFLLIQSNNDKPNVLKVNSLLSGRSVSTVNAESCSPDRFSAVSAGASLGIPGTRLSFVSLGYNEIL